MYQYIFYAFSTRHCRQRHYVSRLSDLVTSVGIIGGWGVRPSSSCIHSPILSSTLTLGAVDPLVLLA